MADLIDRQAVLDALWLKYCNRPLDSDRYLIKDIRDTINSLPSAQPDLDSAYTEGYTAAESKYRKMWDEMQANIKEKAFGKRKGLIHTADIDAMPTIEPEQKVEELLPDGTLHLFTDTDLSKVDRVWVSQNGTHFGDLYYADGDPKIGKWERHYSRPNVYADLCWHCSNCGYKTPDNWANKWKFCPDCGARMVGEGEDNERA